MRPGVRLSPSPSPRSSPSGRGSPQFRNVVFVRSRQRAHPINVRLFRQIILVCLRELLSVETFELGVQFVNARKITRLNEGYLQHAGSTDVITFDYLETRPALAAVFGDIYVLSGNAASISGGFWRYLRLRR
jgi:ssRNA-specific RNase YbeY (16S rRNA maturation enzyme)